MTGRRNAVNWSAMMNSVATRLLGSPPSSRCRGAAMGGTRAGCESTSGAASDTVSSPAKAAVSWSSFHTRCTSRDWMP